VTPEISVRFDQRPGLRWSSSIGRHYRIPTFTEMFGTQGLTVGNDTLKPEHGINAEFALQWQAKDNIDISATVFHSDRTEAIAAIFDAQGVGRHVNIGKARITGLELEANWYLSKRVKVQANITSQNAINLSKISSFTNKQLPGQSALTSLVRLNFQYNERWKFWSEMSVNNQRYYDRGNILPAADSTAINVGALWKKQSLSSRVTLSNLTNQNVEDFNGFPRPGRAIHLGLSKAF